MTSNNPLAWRLADLPAKPTGPTVFSCFHCGGGSSMGYKLAGCDVVGGVEIDPRMVELYRANLKPRISFVSNIRVAPVPDERIDILDGSPPCTPFSMAGTREKGWGQDKAFAEGATKQRLDDLFFAFIAYAAQVKPRVIVAENVSGLLKGNARAYVRRIVEHLDCIGYKAQLFSLTAAHFGVPQARERVFVIAQRKGPKLRRLDIRPLTQHLVTVRTALDGIESYGTPIKAAYSLDWWRRCPAGRTVKDALGIKTGYGIYKINPDCVAPTIVASGNYWHWDRPVRMSGRAIARLQSFPDDYNFGKRSAQYVCGMSVPPFMMRGIAAQIVEQLF